MTVRLRPGTEADIDEFIRIWQGIFRHSFAAMLGTDVNDERFLMGMEHGALIPIVRHITAATLSTRIVGFVYRERAFIEDLWVEPSAQGQGVGRCLLHSAVAAIAADGYRTASLDCLEANLGARRFYEREQWRPVFRHTTWSQSLTQGIPRIRFELDTWRRSAP